LPKYYFFTLKPIHVTADTAIRAPYTIPSNSEGAIFSPYDFYYKNL